MKASDRIYVRVYCSSRDNEKIAGLSDAAFRLWICGLLYSRERLTDGRIGKSVLYGLAPIKRPEKAAAELVAAGSWIETPAGFEIHGYVEYQQTADVVAQKIEQRRAAGKASAERRRNESLNDSLNETATTGQQRGEGEGERERERAEPPPPAVVAREAAAHPDPPNGRPDGGGSDLPDFLRPLGLRGAQRARAVAAVAAAPAAVERIARDVQTATRPGAAFDARIRQGEHLEPVAAPRRVPTLDELRSRPKETA